MPIAWKLDDRRYGNRNIDRGYIKHGKRFEEAHDRQIGNAVPCNLAEAAGRAIAKVLQR